MRRVIRRPTTATRLYNSSVIANILFGASEVGIFYDPSDISTLFQDSAGTTPVTAAGQPVGMVRDKSGNNKHATQATAAARPTYQVDASGRGYLSFDGVDDFLVTPTITPGTDKVQMFAGIRKLSDAAAGIVVELSAGTTSNNGSFYMAAPANAGVSQYVFLSKGTAQQGRVAAGFVAPITNVLTGLGDISGDTATIRVNGISYGTTAGDQGTGNYLAYPLYIGRRGGSSLPFNGRLFGLIVRFGASLSDTNITKTERYIARNTGVTI